MLYRNRIEYKIKTASVFVHLVCIVGNDNFISSKANRINLFVLRSGEDNDIGTKCMCKFHRHVSKSTKTNYTDFLTISNAPVSQGRVGCDSSAEEWCYSGKIEIGRNVKDEMIFNHYAIGVS